MPLKSQLKTSVALPRAPEKRPQEQNERNSGDMPRTISIPEAGSYYFGLSKNGSYDAAARGDIPFIKVGRLKRVSVAAMERLMQEGRAFPAPSPVPEPPQAPRYPPSTAMRRKPRTPALQES